MLSKGILTCQPGLKMTKNQCGENHSMGKKSMGSQFQISSKLPECKRRQCCCSIGSKASSSALYISTCSQNKSLTHSLSESWSQEYWPAPPHCGGWGKESTAIVLPEAINLGFTLSLKLKTICSH